MEGHVIIRQDEAIAVYNLSPCSVNGNNTDAVIHALLVIILATDNLHIDQSANDQTQQEKNYGLDNIKAHIKILKQKRC